jgi:hypothetical protein
LTIYVRQKQKQTFCRGRAEGAARFMKIGLEQEAKAGIVSNLDL